MSPAIQKQTAVDQCEAMLQEAIVEGDLVVGERLLPERELARQLGVNRVTVRSALDRLASAKLLSVRQGSGYVVRDFRRLADLSLLRVVLGQRPKRRKLRTVARDLLLLRRLILGAAVERVLEEPAKGTRRALERAIASLEAASAAPDPQPLRELDDIVIDTIIEGSGSLVLRLALNPCQCWMTDLGALADALATEPLSHLPAWRALARGLSEDGEDSPREVAAEVVAELARADLMALSHL